MNYLVEARNKRGISQAKVAKRVGVSLRTYQYWEAQGFVPKMKHGLRVSQILNVGIKKLLPK